MLSAQVLSHKLALSSSIDWWTTSKISSVENLGLNCPLRRIPFIELAATRDFIVLRRYDDHDGSPFTGARSF